MAKICTRTAQTMQEPYKTILDKIEENRTITGEVLCIKCEMSNFNYELEDIVVSEGFGPKKSMKLRTYRCGVCSYEVIDDKEANLIWIAIH